MDLNRRSFLGGLLGLAATPLIKPKRSLFFFGESYKPNLSLQELQRLYGKRTIRGLRPDVIVVTKDQFSWLWKKMSEYEVLDPETGQRIKPGVWARDLPYGNILFNGTICTEMKNIRGFLYNPVRADIELGRG